MTKKEILDNITDDDTRKAVSTVLDFAEAAAVKAAEGKQDKAEIEALVTDKLKELELDVTKVTGLQEQLDSLGTDVNALKEKGSIEGKDLKSILKEKMDLASKELDSNGGKFRFKIPMSAVNKTTITASSITSDTAGVRIPGFGQLATIKRKIANLFTQFPIGEDSHGTIYWTDQSTATRNAAARAKGDAAAESVLAWTTYSTTLKSISDSIPIHKEMLRHVSLMEAEIRNFIQTNLMLKEDALLVTGDGVTSEIKGVYTYATAFDSAAYTGYKPTTAALMDLILVMATEIEKDSSYTVDTVILNPADALGLTLEKSTDGYRMNIQMMNTAGDMTIRNIKVITSASQTINTLTIGDFTRARRYYGDNIELEFGYNTSGDFAKRIVTLLGNMEELLLVRNCEADAFLKSTDITTDVSNITLAGQ